jgi:hypothetical protein
MTLGITLIALVVAAFAVHGLAQSEVKAKMDIPEAIQHAFLNAYPNATVTGFEEETIDSLTVFAIECKDQGVEKDVLFLADGTIIQVEREIPVDSLPDAITKVVMDAYPDAEIDEAEEISRDTTVEYEIVIEIGKKEIELLMATDGRILALQQETEEDEDDDDEDDQDDDDDEEDD